VGRGGATAAATGVSGIGQAGALTLSGSAAVALTGAVGTGLAGILSADNGVGVLITVAQANLIYESALLHGVVPGNLLTASATARSAGNLVQTVSGTDPVTITTVSSDVLVGDVGVWIDALAAVHGLTTPLVVTATSRDAGTLHQTIANDGTTTTVTA